MSDRSRRALAVVVTLGLAAVVGWGLIVGEPSEGDRVAALGARIKCPVCQGESIVDSPSPYAADILAFVEERVADGWSDEQIVTYLESRFAGVRLDPRFSGSTIALWLLPLALLGAGGYLASRRLAARSELP